MGNNSNKWIYTGLVLLLGILLIAMFFLLRDNAIAPLLGFLGILVSLSSIWIYNKFEDSSESKAQLLEKEIAFKYQLDEILVANNLSGAVGVSNEKELIYLFSRLDVFTGINEDMIKNQFHINTVTFDKIKQINVIENDVTIVKSNVNDLVGKSVKGGFGNNGIDNKKVIHKVRLQIVTDDVLNPTSDVFLYNEGYGLKVGNDDYNNFHRNIERIYKAVNLTYFERG